MTKSLSWLLGSVLKDMSTRCGTDTHRDYITVSRRIQHEGLSFLTITLPNFAKDFESCLEQGSVGPSHFLGFKKRGELPVFLRGFLIQVFDPVGGKLLPEPAEESIFCIRQLCLMFKKINLPCSEARERKVIRDYKQLEDMLTGLTDAIPETEWSQFGLLSDVLWGNPLSLLSERAESGGFTPSHGPGATGERISGNQKYVLQRWHTRLQTLFPFDWYGHSSLCHESGRSGADGVEFVEPGAENPVRVITVPKTLKGPRVIAIEPVCMQYIQQGVLADLVKVLESHPHTSGHVNFTDQGVNRNLALLSSEDGRLATMDLSEASDRVHKDVVYRMLRSNPSFRDAVFACRSHTASLPDGTTCPLNKFASMGSALCFPIEAMVFYTLCIQSRLQSANLPPTPSNIRRMKEDVYVYGDDLIVPADEVPAITALLETFGLKVNNHKTFYTGKFRESCGMDAYNGVDITPVYCRRMPPCNRRDSSSVISYVEFSNQLHKAGFWNTADSVRKYVERKLRTPLPLVRDGAPCLGWTSFRQAYTFQRYNKDLQTPEVKGFTVHVGRRQDQIDGQAALMKCLLRRGLKLFDAGHLERSVRPGSVNIKYRWAFPY